MAASLALLLAASAAASPGAAPAQGALRELEAQAPAGAVQAPPEAVPTALEPFVGTNPGELGPDLPVAHTKDFPGPVFLKNRLLLPLPGTDRDEDGLGDLAEAELAFAFRPLLVFDSHENARPAGEPVTLYQARPLGCAGPRSRCDGRPLQVRLVYLNLWTWDKGYGPASLFCRIDTHKGDNQAVRLLLESRDDGHSFRVTEIDIGAFVWPRKSGGVRFLGGTHFWLYFSAGKHHHFFDTSGDRKPSPYSKWSCRENVDGKGFFNLAILSAPSGAGGFLFNNAGEPEAHPSAHFVGSLSAYKFPGEHAWAKKPFCGGLKCAPDNPTQTNFGVWSREEFFVP